MENRILTITPAPVDYTITITNQKGECLIYPGNSTSWRLAAGMTIQFVNTTLDDVTVEVDPKGYEGNNTFTIGGSSVVVKRVITLQPDELQRTLTHTFNCGTPNQAEAITGGPRMVITK